ncbi:hypothetical protein MHU86_22932 [Fragilaria crotonensis]|nr:hypothetical protein MHU86_22932 [Fragilaria crotonensis]
MSYTSTLSDHMIQDEPEKSGAPRTVNVIVNKGGQKTWAQRLRGAKLSPSTDQNSVPTTTQGTSFDEDYLSDLASSRAEVEELRMRINTYEETNKLHQREMELQRRELEQKAQQDKMAVERKA